MTPENTEFTFNHLARERIPEHSILLMKAFSGGKAFDVGSYRFYHGNDWLYAIGYPLEGRYNSHRFAKALEEAQARTSPDSCFAIGPDLPDALQEHIIEKDRFYVLSAKAAVPSKLRGPVKQAGTKLQVRVSSHFTPAHRRLWGEFLAANSTRLKSRVAELYAQTPHAIENGSANLILLDAMDRQGNLAASLLLDAEPANFISYIIGAHSRKFYVPHATDLLFERLLDLARIKNKAFIHLGLGVNDGILRFKLKWRAKPALPFLMAQWETGKSVAEERITLTFARAILNSPQLSKAQILQNEPPERPFAMLWQVEKNNRISWLGGTAHFFSHSFAGSFNSLFSKVDRVIFEGPLDSRFMADVDTAGKILPNDFKPLAELMTDREIMNLERMVTGPKGKLARLAGMEKPTRIDIRWLLANSLPWYAFFTIWTTFLERLGWRQSVDMEAWRTAKAMNLEIIGMESLEEQLESLGSLPVSRVLGFFRSCQGWKKRAKHNMNAYLAGDLEKMMGTSAEFPTRTEHIIGNRDQRFRERMRPWLEKGNTAVFVGCAHIVNLRHMLVEDGFRVSQKPFGLWPRLCLKWRQLKRPDAGVKW